MEVKVFRSARYQWLDAVKEFDPKLQQLYNELEATWVAYSQKSYELDKVYLDTGLHARLKLEYAFDPAPKVKTVTKVKNALIGSKWE